MRFLSRPFGMWGKQFGKAKWQGKLGWSVVLLAMLFAAALVLPVIIVVLLAVAVARWEIHPRFTVLLFVAMLATIVGLALIHENAGWMVAGYIGAAPGLYEKTGMATSSVPLWRIIPLLGLVFFVVYSVAGMKHHRPSREALSDKSDRDGASLASKRNHLKPIVLGKATKYADPARTVHVLKESAARQKAAKES